MPIRLDDVPPTAAVSEPPQPRLRKVRDQVTPDARVIYYIPIRTQDGRTFVGAWAVPAECADADMDADVIAYMTRKHAEAKAAHEPAPPSHLRLA